MSRYAKETVVPVERSRAEIEATVRRYEATKFTSGWDEDHNMAFIMFHIRGLYIRFAIPLPKGDEKEFTHVFDKRRNYSKRRTEQQRIREVEQATRQRWRALLLAIKGKLEAVDCGISTIEMEFMAHIVLPGDQLLGEWLLAEALPQIKAGKVPQIGYKASEQPSDEPQDAEFEVKV